MRRPPVTIAVAFVRGMVSGVMARGEPCDHLLEDAGIAPALLHEAGGRVTAEQYVALFRLLIDRFDDECLAFLSRPIRRGSFALMTRSAVDAPSLEMAIRRVAHIFRLLQDDLRLELVRDGRSAGLALRFTEGTATPLPFLHELLVRTFWRLLAWLAGGQLPATRFEFAFARPRHASSYGKVFPGPLHFGCDASAFWFDGERLAGAVRRDEAAMRVFLADAQAEIIVPSRGDAQFSARVRIHLQQTQADWPDLAATASALHTSTSTLQRHLASEGTSFQSLKSNLRRDTAIVRLNTSDVTLTVLASELGFADCPAFQRAFKAWTGSAPGSYRRGAR